MPRISFTASASRCGGGLGMCWCRRLFAPGRDLIALTGSLFLIALASGPASAQFYVRSPEVDKGEAEIEENGALYSGPGEDERLRQAHEIEGKYGITERFEVILEGELEQPIGEDLGGKAIELGGQYEIIKRHGDGLGVAFRTLYEFALPDNSPDEILFGPLARVVRGRDSATINTFFVGQLGDHVEIDEDYLLLDSKEVEHGQHAANFKNGFFHNGSLLFIVTSSYDLGRQNFRPRSLLVILLPAARELCPWGMRGSMPSVSSAFPILKRQGPGSILRLPDLNEKDICPQACMSKYGARRRLSALG
jgi:hypothetical protein